MNLFGKKKGTAPEDVPALPANWVPPITKESLQKLLSSSVPCSFTLPELERLQSRYESLMDKGTNRLPLSTFLGSTPELACCAVAPLLSANIIRRTYVPPPPGPAVAAAQPQPPASAPSPAAPAGAATGGGAGGVPKKDGAVAAAASSSSDPLSASLLTFEVFVNILSILSPKTAPSVKLRHLFDSLDFEGDGLLQEENLFAYFKYSLGAVASDDVCQNIAREALREAGKMDERTKRVVISFEGFQKIVDHISLEQKITVHY